MYAKLWPILQLMLLNGVDLDMLFLSQYIDLLLSL